jgi:alpha-tubulin suppressor-like RCC1 family protein
MKRMSGVVVLCAAWMWTGQARAEGVPDVLLSENAVHGCVVDATRQLKCWPHVHASAPLAAVLVKGASDVRALAMIKQGGCVVRGEEGALWCWGDVVNDPEPDAASAALPTGLKQVKGVPGKIVQLVSAGHLCALNDAGAVYCWGDNTSGQAAPDNKATQVKAPALVKGLGAVKQIAAGAKHACALEREGAVWCWGNNLERQVDISAVSAQTGPIKAAHAQGASALGAGGHTTCALLKGQARCWGKDYTGGSNDAGVGWVLIKELKGATQIDCAGSKLSTSCLAQDSQGVKHWQSIHYNGSEAIASIPGLEPIARKLDATQVFHSGELLMVRGSGGKLKQPGSSLAAVFERALFPGGGLFTPLHREVEYGWRARCALMESGQVWCRGANKAGQLGDGTTKDREGYAPVKGLTNKVVELGLGREHGCSLDTAGVVYCWGGNQSGQLGSGDKKSALMPVRVKGLELVRRLAVGAAHTCAIEQSGRALCWGECGGGQCAGLSGQVLSPTPVAALEGASALSATLEHTCATLKDRSSRCWGASRGGIRAMYISRLNEGSGEDGIVEDEEGHIYSWESRFDDEAKEMKHHLALQGDGRVEQVEQDGLGGLAVRLADGRVMLRQGMMWRWARSSDKYGEVPELKGARSVELGQGVLCAIMKDRTVRCHGASEYGKLGDGGGKRDKPVTATVKGLSKVVALRHTLGAMCALREDATVWCWGVASGLPGILRREVREPAKIEALSGAIELEPGCAVFKGGARRCWGELEAALRAD